MKFSTFMFGIFCLIPIYALVFMLYRYIDMKYFSELEINRLKEENKYLKEENKKINGSSANFWSNE